jgi:hypothetical protein
MQEMGSAFQSRLARAMIMAHMTTATPQYFHRVISSALWAAIKIIPLPTTRLKIKNLMAAETINIDDKDNTGR